MPRIAPLLGTMAAFAVLMAVAFVQKAYSILTDAETGLLEEPDTRAWLGVETAVVEAIDTAIVLVAWLLIRRPPTGPRPAQPALAWLVSAPALVILLGFNFAYHFVWETVLRAFRGPDLEAIAIGLRTEGWWAVWMVGVQPALIEELFFRHLLYGHLRPHVGTHAAVGLTAVLFGMAHLNAVPSWPVLLVLGVGLGYARAYSGGLALPMGLHFLHNMAILGVAAWR